MKESTDICFAVTFLWIDLWKKKKGVFWLSFFLKNFISIVDWSHKPQIGQPFHFAFKTPMDSFEISESFT